MQRIRGGGMSPPGCARRNGSGALRALRDERSQRVGALQRSEKRAVMVADQIAVRLWRVRRSAPLRSGLGTRACRGNPEAAHGWAAYRRRWTMDGLPRRFGISSSCEAPPVGCGGGWRSPTDHRAPTRQVRFATHQIASAAWRCAQMERQTVLRPRLQKSRGFGKSTGTPSSLHVPATQSRSRRAGVACTRKWNNTFCSMLPRAALAPGPFAHTPTSSPPSRSGDRRHGWCPSLPRCRRRGSWSPERLPRRC